MDNIIVWTPGNGRIWWACPTCKIEAGITLPVPITDMQDRMRKFTEQHKDCEKKEATWRKSV